MRLIKLDLDRSKVFEVREPLNDLEPGDYLAIGDKMTNLKEFFHIDEKNKEFLKLADIKVSKNGIEIKL